MIGDQLRVPGTQGSSERPGDEKGARGGTPGSRAGGRRLSGGDSSQPPSSMQRARRRRGWLSGFGRAGVAPSSVVAAAPVCPQPPRRLGAPTRPRPRRSPRPAARPLHPTLGLHLGRLGGRGPALHGSPWNASPVPGTGTAPSGRPEPFLPFQVLFSGTWAQGPFLGGPPSPPPQSRSPPQGTQSPPTPAISPERDLGALGGERRAGGGPCTHPRQGSVITLHPGPAPGNDRAAGPGCIFRPAIDSGGDAACPTVGRGDMGWDAKSGGAKVGGRVQGSRARKAKDPSRDGTGRGGGGGEKLDESGETGSRRDEATSWRAPGAPTSGRGGCAPACRLATGEEAASEPRRRRPLALRRPEQGAFERSPAPRTSHPAPQSTQCPPKPCPGNLNLGGLGDDVQGRLVCAPFPASSRTQARRPPSPGPQGHPSQWRKTAVFI